MKTIAAQVPPETHKNFRRVAARLNTPMGSLAGAAIAAFIRSPNISSLLSQPIQPITPSK